MTQNKGTKGKRKPARQDKTVTRISEKHKVFALWYALTENATESAIKAGFSKETADKKAYKWVGKSRDKSFYPELFDLVLEIRSTKIAPKLENEFNITATDILNRLAVIGFTECTDIIQVEEIEIEVGKGNNKTRTKIRAAVPFLTSQVPKDKLAAIAEIKQTESGVQIKMHNPILALELLGKYKGLWKDNISVQLPPNVSVTVSSEGKDPEVNDEF